MHVALVPAYLHAVAALQAVIVGQSRSFGKTNLKDFVALFSEILRKSSRRICHIWFQMWCRPLSMEPPKKMRVKFALNSVKYCEYDKRGVKLR